MMDQDGLHVVLGGSGGVGSAVSRLLAEEGLRVRAVSRSGRAVGVPRRVECVAAEALELDSLRNACHGAAVVYHCLRPVRDDSLYPVLTRTVLDVVQGSGARLVMAGCADVYGTPDGPLTEELPFDPRGAVAKAHVEAAVLASKAHAAGRVPVAIGRASHTYGPYTRHVWPGLDFEAALRGLPARVIGDIDAPHTYTYVDDFARGLIALALNEDAFGRAWHLPSAPPISTRALVELLYDEADVKLVLKPQGSGGIKLRSLVSREHERLRQLLPEFEKPWVVDHSRFDATFGSEPTPHQGAVRITVAWKRRVH